VDALDILKSQHEEKKPDYQTLTDLSEKIAEQGLTDLHMICEYSFEQISTKWNSFEMMLGNRNRDLNMEMIKQKRTSFVSLIP
jgi:hypothetical protein